MPAGLDVTEPVPDPAVATVSANVAATWLNVAVTVCAALIVTVQVAVVPLHAPPQPPNVLPVAGAAVSVTVAPVVKLAEQVPGQVIPVGADVTVPVPVPLVVRVSV